MKLKPAIVFGENMVLQRSKPINVWGVCAGGDIVDVKLGDNVATCESNRGKWSVTLPAMEACEKIEMTISARNTGEKIVFSNVAIGEVWLAGGQSNMEFLFKYDVNAADLIPTANDPLLRFFDMPEVTYAGHYDLGYFENYGFWREWRPQDAQWFSAVGYYFARKLREQFNVPVAILGCNYGGTVSSAWTDMETLKNNPDLQPVLDFFNDAYAKVDVREYEEAIMANTLRDPEIMQPMLDKLMMGEKPEFPANFMKRDPNAPKPIFFYNGPKSQNAPSCLYNNMLKAVMPYSIRGFIWYQGESDEDHGWASFYDKSIAAMIDCWRKGWGGEELPFLQVMLAPFDGWGTAKAKEYPLLRKMQLKACEDNANVYCACIMDAGDAENIHPRRKQPAGERLALLAKKYVYGIEGIEADSASPIGAEFADGKVVVTLKNVAGGLVADGNVKTVRAFVDGAEVECTAVAEGDKVIVDSAAFADAKTAEIRFAEENYCEPNLVGGTGLPVFPFTVIASK